MASKRACGNRKCKAADFASISNRMGLKPDRSNLDRSDVSTNCSASLSLRSEGMGFGLVFIVRSVSLILCLHRGVRADLNAHHQHRCHNRFAAAKDLTKLQASVDGLVPVIVGLRVPFAPEGAISVGTVDNL